MKKLFLLSIVVVGASLASCTKYGCSCNGQPVNGETYTENEPGSNLAQLSCEADSDCDWVKAE